MVETLSYIPSAIMKCDLDTHSIERWDFLFPLFKSWQAYDLLITNKKQ